MSKCRFSGCRIFPQQTGLCIFHHKQYVDNNNDLSKLTKLDILIKQIDCVIEGCHNQALSKGLCTTHYGQVRRFGKVNYNHLEVKGFQFNECNYTDCGNEATRGGYCLSHRRQLRCKGGNESKLTSLVPIQQRFKCSLPDCSNDVREGKCDKHYREERFNLNQEKKRRREKVTIF